MTAYTAILASDIDPESPITSALMTSMRDNPIAITEGAAGAPRIQSAAFAAGAVNAPAIAGGVVAQGHLKTAFGDVATPNATSGSAVLPGGEYGFYPSLLSNAGPTRVMIAYAGGTGTRIAHESTDGTAQTITARQRYVTASPPYDLGDGEVPLFVFALLDKNGTVVGSYIAQDPPWAHNGPTRITPDYYDDQGRGWQVRKRGDFRAMAADPSARARWLAEPTETVEVTRSIKNADMPLIPHPFPDHAGGLTPVLLDPVGELAGQLLAIHQSGESVTGILRDYLSLDNTPLKRRTPQGVRAHAARWR